MARLHIFGGDPARNSSDAVAVIGLGRFGASLALELMAGGTEVLGIDPVESVVQDLNGKLTHVVRADATGEEVLRQLGVAEYGRVVVAIGSHLEASILTTSLLLRFGVKDIWAKAVSEAHGTILQQLGVPHVVFPERDMGRRVAHLVRGSMQDYVDLEAGYALIKTRPPSSLIGKSLGQADVRKAHGVTIVARHPDGGEWEDATPSTVLASGDLVLVTGRKRRVEAFAALT
ncbi:potassium channel family protein [Serinibacter salmoneus]|uniref:Trk system potassium uptake protein TrkA n=1 Tax=Serinibacter salmoneus TaxID=556530 RepID=A0A2A9D319_9MICO|nr:TrkA family potassium uptake protein [Serinibacter salmoneus]PFG21054.1 trk system potassium uptake protein TrkA [Serinibacter salmoneus]